jgi:hypothetical protein
MKCDAVKKLNMHHPDLMWIEYTTRRDQFLGETHAEQLANLAARGRRQLDPVRPQGGGASWASWRRHRSPGCRASCDPYASSVIDGGIVTTRAGTVNRHVRHHMVAELEL